MEPEPNPDLEPSELRRALDNYSQTLHSLELEARWIDDILSKAVRACEELTAELRKRKIPTAQLSYETQAFIMTMDLGSLKP